MDFRLLSRSSFLKEYFSLGLPVVLVVFLDERLQGHGHRRSLWHWSSNIKPQSGFLCSFGSFSTDYGYRRAFSWRRA